MKILKTAKFEKLAQLGPYVQPQNIQPQQQVSPQEVEKEKYNRTCPYCENLLNWGPGQDENLESCMTCGKRQPPVGTENVYNWQDING